MTDIEKLNAAISVELGAGPEDDETDVTRLHVHGKEVILVGTAHISQRSVEVVERVIDAERPDVVCVELDDERYRALVEEQNWQQLNLTEVIKKKQLLFLMARLALMAFQKRMGSYTGVKPGAEMAAAIHAAHAMDARLVLCDRNVRTTLIRAWRLTPFWRRAAVAGSLMAGVFDRNQINEDELANLRDSQNISNVLDELGQALPSVKQVLVDERDLFMAHQIQNAPGQKVVVIIGAAHKPGILLRLQETITDAAVEAVTIIPARSSISRVLPWLIPLIVVALFIVGFAYGDREQFQSAAIAWVLANGIFAALGALIAMAHPLTIIAAFIAAPITSLNPTIGAGMVTAFVQTMVCSPKVSDMENVGDDIANLSGWWKNRLARVFLVFLLSSFGSTIGTFVAFGWLKNLV
ncbi:MAG: TraB/GumN family protein [Bradymonadaceae bacterium]|nr:TraB/GumN family protein [Lujinxingiaceae bacterium]